MADSVYRVTELVGTSSQSWEAAAKSAIETASKTLRDLRVAEVVRQDVTIENGKVGVYRVRLLHGLGIGDRILHPVVPAVEVGALLGPQGPDDAQRLAQPPDAVVESVEAVHLVLYLGPRGADAELEASA